MKKWTQDQENAIFAKWRDEEKTKSANILVNAAAGSGKTAVLVERIINKLSSEHSSPDYCDVENLLVVTFTNAAAKEMQERISDALTKKYNASLAENAMQRAENLKKQISALHSADITTIDAFCLKTVKKYFHLLEKDPNFKIIDQTEALMLKDDAMEQLFEDYYSDEEFIKLMCLYSDSRDDRGLAETIKKIYDFTRSQPNPLEWMEKKCEVLKDCTEKSDIFVQTKNKVDKLLKKACNLLGEAINRLADYCLFEKKRNEEEIEKLIELYPTEENNALYLSFASIYDNVLKEYQLYKSLIGKTWDELYYRVRSAEFARINAKPKFKDESYLVSDKAVTAPIVELRNAAKDIFTKKITPILYDTAENIIKISREELYPVTKALVRFTELFERYYNEKKEKRNAMEFSDIEHLCLKLFIENPEVAEEMRNKYSEILMDEYQDSNALQEAIFNAISRGNNLFMVGDMKQSIYRFRSSDPYLFKSKCDIYEKDEKAENRKIVLSKNFRSRSQVLASVNSVFENIMSEHMGGIAYNEDQRLNYGDTYAEEYNEEMGGYKSECCVLLEGDESDVFEGDEILSADQLQARFIAKKIKEMKNSKFMVRDKKIVVENEDGKEIKKEIDYYRPVQNKDFAIIMSSYKNSSKIYLEELSAQGIDCFAQTGGYFDKAEIRLTMSLLKMISNPYNDVSLIGVMRSFIFGFSDDDLSVIRIYSRDKFYDCVKNAANDCNDEEIKSKCLFLLKKIKEWRKYSKYMSSDRLIWTLYEETDMYSFSEMLYGEDAAANLRLLFNRAKQYEASGYKGLFNFVRYVGKIKDKNDDLSGATMLGENSDVVRLMTIHKSKGLEFPVCFLAGASKKFNMSDVSGKLIMHKDAGFGLDYINYDESYSMPTLSKMYISGKITSESISEEMRKLYVGMTRAKEKLIVVATAKKNNNSAFAEDTCVEYDNWKNVWDESMGKLKENMPGEAKRFIDWIAPVAMKDEENWIFNIVKYNDTVKKIFELSVVTEEDNCKDNKSIPLPDFNFDTYKFEEETVMPVKLSVSEIKRKQNSAENNLSREPMFLQKHSGISAAQRGTAIHYVMQKLTPRENLDFEYVAECIGKMVKNNELTKEEAAAVEPEMIVDFYKSDLGQRILRSKRVVREAPFEITVPAAQVLDTRLDTEVIVQGIIDCYFYEGDEIVIVDYKSDHYENVEEIKQKYAIQLEYYKAAVEKICKKTVKCSFLYLFFTKNVIQY